MKVLFSGLERTVTQHLAHQETVHLATLKQPGSCRMPAGVRCKLRIHYSEGLLEFSELPIDLELRDAEYHP